MGTPAARMSAGSAVVSAQGVVELWRAAAADAATAQVILARASSRAGAHAAALPVLEVAHAQSPQDEPLLADLRTADPGRRPLPAAGTSDGRLGWTVPVFASYDGTEIGYRVVGDGPPLVCLPGGPGRAAGYLGDLGGVSRSRQLILLDPRGVGLSADPADPATLRVDLLVRDVDALRAHLGLERMDLLAHSAGAVLATLYAAAHPDRLSRLILVTPGLAAVGVGPTGEQVRAALARRSAEPWYPAALTAMEKFIAGDLSAETFEASRPFFYARWDDASQAHATAGIAPGHAAARQGFFAGAPFDAPSTRAALKELNAPVLLYAGDLDPIATPAVVRVAAPLFNDATVVVQPQVAHFPWVDDPAAFAAAIRSLPRLTAAASAIPR
jgi:pimeloyl-ACP methyl ester carboxylesterase